MQILCAHMDASSVSGDLCVGLLLHPPRDNDAYTVALATRRRFFGCLLLRWLKVIRANKTFQGAQQWISAAR